MRALHIPVDADPVIVDLEESLQVIYDYTDGGPIEAVYDATGAVLFLNEEGIPLDLPFNPIATVLVESTGSAMYGGYVRGSVLVVGPAGPEGEATDVPDAFIQKVIQGPPFTV